MISGTTGITYYKIEDRYEGDVTKGCGLIGSEIDKNFHFLRGKDAKAIFIDEENGSLVFVLLNGEKLVVENFSEYISSLGTSISGITYNEELGILTVFSGEETFSVSGFTTIGDIKVKSDEKTTFGDGTNNNPIRINVSYQTGVYSPVELLDDISDARVGHRYLIREYVESPCNEGVFEWLYFIYDYDIILQEWVKKELLPGERVIIKKYLELDNVEVICKTSDNGSILEVYKKILDSIYAVKISENSTHQTIWLKIQDGEKILSQGENGLKTTISINYVKEENRVPQIQIKGKNNSIISYIEVGDFLCDNYIGDIKLSGNSLYFDFISKTATGETKTVKEIPLDGLSLYNEGKAIEITPSKTINVKIDAYSEPFLVFGNNGLKITGITNAINEKVNALSSVTTDIINELSAGTKNEIETLSENISSEIDAINGDISNIKNDVGSLSSATRENLNIVNSAITAIENKIDDFSAQTLSGVSIVKDMVLELSGETVSNFEEINSNIHTLSSETNERINGIETDISSIREDIQNISGQTLSGVSIVKDMVLELSAATNGNINYINSGLSLLNEKIEQEKEERISTYSGLNSSISEETQKRERLEKYTKEAVSAISETIDVIIEDIGAIEENVSGITEDIKNIWEELNKKDSGVLSRDITFSGKDGELIFLSAGTPVTDAIEIVAEQLGGGDGKVKDIIVNEHSILNESTGIANINIENTDDDISVLYENKTIYIGINGISNETIIL